MLPTGLFIDSPETQDASMHQLTNDTDAWPEEIITKLKERIPDVNGMNAIVKFMKIDEETGTATGSIVVSNAKQSAVVPVIIKDFSMYPLDVFIAAKKLLPLTPDFFNSIFQENEAMTSLDEYPSAGDLGNFDGNNLWNVTYPPSLGRYAYASANYPIMEEIASTIDGASLKENLLEDTQSAVRFHKHGHAEMISKVANMQPVNLNEFAQGADNLIDRNIVMLRKEGPHKYSILSSSDMVYAPQIKFNQAPAYCKPFIARISGEVEDAMNEVDQNGEKILHIDSSVPDHELYIEQGVENTVEVATQFGFFSVKKKNGVNVEGVVIPKVIDLDMNLMPLKIFLGKTMSTVQTDIAGVRLTNSNYKIPHCYPQVGQAGCFVFQKEQTNALATIPFTVISVAEMYSDLMVKVHDLNGKAYKLKVIRDGGMGLERIAYNAQEDFYMIPASMKWSPMEGFFEISSNPIDHAIKLAGESKTASPVRIIRNGENNFCIKGADKYASEAGWDKTNLEGYQTRFILASLGASHVKVAHIMKIASEYGEATIHGLKSPLTQTEKTAKLAPLKEKMNKLASKVRCNLVKEASYIENSQTVDALLSLNFVNPENVNKFVGKIPAIKGAISNLASLLIASRIGIKEIPEQAVSSAIQRLTEIVNGLETLRATQEG